MPKSLTTLNFIIVYFYILNCYIEPDFFFYINKDIYTINWCIKITRMQKIKR